MNNLYELNLNIVEFSVFFYLLNFENLQLFSKKATVFVDVVVMTRHECKKLVCPSDNVSGPKINCIKCRTCCYLKCFGFEAGPIIENNETVKKVVNGSVVVMFVSCMAFVCCDETATTEEIRKVLKMPKACESSRGRPMNNDAIANEMKAMKEMLNSIKNATDVNTVEIAEIKSMTAKTEATV